MALVEIITHAGCYEYIDCSAAEIALRSLQADIRLDYHYVWDTLPAEFACPEACILSFVGRQSTTRSDTRIAIQQAVAAGRVAFGVLVFKRGSTKPATKAWANALIGSSRWPALFIDDSDDHLETSLIVMGERIYVWKNEVPADPTTLMEKIADYMRCSVAVLVQ